MARRTETAARDAILTLLNQSGAGKTICPSEAARVLAGSLQDWRPHMDTVHAATDALVEAEAISLSWKGERLSRRSGPYRIALRRSANKGKALS